MTFVEPDETITSLNYSSKDNVYTQSVKDAAKN